MKFFDILKKAVPVAQVVMASELARLVIAVAEEHERKVGQSVLGQTVPLREICEDIAGEQLGEPLYLLLKYSWSPIVEWAQRNQK